MGGEHIEPAQVKTMMDCIQICQTAAGFMRRDSYMHEVVCEACAKICEVCADSCEEISDDAMTRCADICRECANTCGQMSLQNQAA